MTQPFDDLRRYADDLASEVSPLAAQRAVRSAMSPHVNRPRKLVVALVATGLLGVSNVALAAVADPAVPGDALYKVDRAYERLVDFAGFGGPRVSERVYETSVLVERGNLGMALDLVHETLTKILESDDPAGYLNELEAELGSQPDAVAALVMIAKDTATSGADVSEAARQLGEHLRDLLSQRPDHAGPPAGSPSETRPGPPADRPSNNPGQNRP
jgi:hypothetical protein